MPDSRAKRFSNLLHFGISKFQIENIRFINPALIKLI